MPSHDLSDYAGFWRRTTALTIDSGVLWVVWLIVGSFFPTPPSPTRFASFDAFATYLSTALVPGQVMADAVLTWAYFALQESSNAQATIGKRLMGIRVSSESDARLSLAAASVRTWPMYLVNVAWLASWVLGSVVGLAGLIACLSVAFSARKQGLHDKMAGAILTRV